MNDDHSPLEPEILEAYRVLGTPVSAPADMLQRVEKRITRRRTARRGIAGVAVLAVAGGIGIAVLGGSDGTGDQVAADQGGTETSTLVFTDLAGDPHAFAAEDIEVACTADGRLYLGRNATIEAISKGGDPEDAPLVKPVLYVELIVDKIQPGQVFTLPHDGPGSSDHRAMTFFFTSDDGDERDNELSSAEGDASGTVTVNEASCGADPVLDISIDGVLGSEVGQPALPITGAYHS